MKAYLINLHLLIPRSMSSAKVKVKYRGYISQKMAVSMVFVFHKHILFLMFGWHPRLSIDAYFGNDPPVVKQCLWITPLCFRSCVNGLNLHIGQLEKKPPNLLCTIKLSLTKDLKSIHLNMVIGYLSAKLDLLQRIKLLTSGTVTYISLFLSLILTFRFLRFKEKENTVSSELYTGICCFR